jgi:hypothetical protein
MAERRIAVTQERVKEAIFAFENACRAGEMAYTVEMETGDPFDLMISHARYHDMTIFGLKSLFDCGITDEPKDALLRLLSQGVRPIVAVSPHFRNVRSALIACSGSMESAKAMRRFVQMRLWPDLRIQVVHFSSDAAKGKELLNAAAARLLPRPGVRNRNPAGRRRRQKWHPRPCAAIRCRHHRDGKQHTKRHAPSNLRQHGACYDPERRPPLVPSAVKNQGRMPRHSLHLHSRSDRPE